METNLKKKQHYFLKF